MVAELGRAEHGHRRFEERVLDKRAEERVGGGAVGISGEFIGECGGRTEWPLATTDPDLLPLSAQTVSFPLFIDPEERPLGGLGDRHSQALLFESSDRGTHFVGELARSREFLLDLGLGEFPQPLGADRQKPSRCEEVDPHPNELIRRPVFDETREAFAPLGAVGATVEQRLDGGETRGAVELVFEPPDHPATGVERVREFDGSRSSPPEDGPPPQLFRIVILGCDPEQRHGGDSGGGQIVGDTDHRERLHREHQRSSPDGGLLPRDGDLGVGICESLDRALRRLGEIEFIPPRAQGGEHTLATLGVGSSGSNRLRELRPISGDRPAERPGGGAAIRAELEQSISRTAPPRERPAAVHRTSSRRAIMIILGPTPRRHGAPEKSPKMSTGRQHSAVRISSISGRE